jgi:hypothetical protein
MFESPEQPANSARFTFLDPASLDFYPDWDVVADELVATLRSTVGRYPRDRVLAELIEELVARSDQFSSRWSAHHVRFHRTGSKRIRHPEVGELTVSYETMEISADPGLMMALYTTAPGSPSQTAMDILSSWSATPHNVAKLAAQPGSADD